MAKNQDEQLMEFVGKWVPKTAPIWIPGGLIAFYLWKPENFHKIFSPYYPVIKKGILALIFISILIIIFLTARFWIYRNFEKKRYEYFKIVPHQEQNISPASVHEMIGMIAGYKRPKRIRMIRGRGWFQWLILKDLEGIQFYIGFPQDRTTGILRMIKNVYPEAELHPIEHVPIPSRSAYSGRMTME
jgi:hypothetical protein